MEDQNLGDAWKAWVANACVVHIQSLDIDGSAPVFVAVVVDFPQYKRDKSCSLLICMMHDGLGSNWRLGWYMYIP